MNPISYLSQALEQSFVPIVIRNTLSKFLPAFDISPIPSNARHVFQTTEEMKAEFVKFLTTIFYKLDDKKVLQKMEEILRDPNKTDKQIYKELLLNIRGMKKRFAPLLELWSLRVLKNGMGRQAAELLKNFHEAKFHDYLEIYDRRYLNDIRNATGMPFDGKTIAVSNTKDVTFIDRLQAGAALSKYPYKTHVPLNDPDCENPLEAPEKTCKPIDESVADSSIDLISCLGGLHHIPKERVDAFVSSLRKKLRPGGVILLREHNVTDENIRSIAALVHTFVNVADEMSWEVENKEIREFKTIADWTEMMKKHHFTPISSKPLILQEDPTKNGMVAFIKNPNNLDEMHQAIEYRNDCTRPKEGTFATWIEWGNVRSSKQYAQFIQTHHAYAFDYIGHIRQHWQHFSNYIAESRNHGVSFASLVFSSNFAMNMFILLSAAIQYSIGQLTALPSMGIARWRHGSNWRSIANLTDLEKLEAKIEKEYSDFIDHTPFYMFDYLSKIKDVWTTVIHSTEHWTTKTANIFNASIWSLGLLVKASVAAPVRAIFTSETALEPDTIKILIKDRSNALNKVIERWEQEKDHKYEAHQKIEIIYSTPDGYKLVSVPRYRPFTSICSYLAETTTLDLLEVGSQQEISIDVLLKKSEPTPEIPGARIVYEMDRLQDPEEKRYVTYHVAVRALQSFERAIGSNRIEYIHE